jgi:hypothetical protein
MFGCLACWFLGILDYWIIGFLDVWNCAITFRKDSPTNQNSKNQKTTKPNIWGSHSFTLSTRLGDV